MFKKCDGENAFTWEVWQIILDKIAGTTGVFFWIGLFLSMIFTHWLSY
jgi:hypothetical protein